MDFKIRMEEDFLQHKFGQPYLDYCARTGRYLR
jgi:protein-S-isoprenylcysteine O-methyltransferase Ste14